MKTLILILISLLISYSLKAQQQTNVTYLTQPDLERFTGGWQYVSHDTTFLINLKLVKTFVNNEPLYIDAIQGDYIIKKGGEILHSSVGCKTIKSGGYVDKSISKDKINFLFYDLGKKSKSGDVVFELLNSSANTASWKLTNTEGVRIGYYDYSFSVPEKAVFTRIR